MSEARRAILERVASELRGVERPALPPLYRGLALPPHEHVARFTSVLERVGSKVHRLRSSSEARATLQGLLREAAATRLIVSDAPEVRALAEGLPGVELLAPTAPREQLFAASAGLTSAQWGIAETGTLVLESAREQHRLASLVVPLHVALLRAEHLLGTLGEALAALQTPTGAPASRTITFVTGPSRTADIELELVVGVHGPKSLHVLLLEAP